MRGKGVFERAWEVRMAQIRETMDKVYSSQEMRWAHREARFWCQMAIFQYNY